ncbi:MAG: hypothetical protein IK024_04065 [Treponema sp.]|nr:hypothetical protein [Treponema sp.]
MNKFFNAMNKCFLAAIIALNLVCVLFSGCKNKDKAKEDQKIVEIGTQKTDHVWYYFNQDGFVQVDSPRNAPFAGSFPYTEAVRISSANNGATDLDGTVKAYALANRLGVICFENDKISVAKDVNVFANRTAANLVFIDGTPLFSVYKSAFFNDTISSATYKKDTSAHLFLVQFDDTSKISYPVINSTNLTELTNAEVTDFYWNGKEWFCCIKSVSGDASGKTDFSYIKFTPAAPITSISPVSAEDLITVKQSSVNEFREVMNVKPYAQAPERIRNMLQSFDKAIPFMIEVKSAAGSSPRIYENEAPGSFETELNAKAIISQSWSAALFEDGTLFIEGALPGKHILRSGKPVAIRLPKLDEGYVYSDFVISGTTLYAAWEETDFYKVSRSGFLSVDLDSTLYSIIR